jgi:hypothetical protein
MHRGLADDYCVCVGTHAWSWWNTTGNVVLYDGPRVDIVIRVNDSGDGAMNPWLPYSAQQQHVLRSAAVCMHYQPSALHGSRDPAVGKLHTKVVVLSCFNPTWVATPRNSDTARWTGHAHGPCCTTARPQHFKTGGGGTAPFQVHGCAGLAAYYCRGQACSADDGGTHRLQRR